MILKGTPKSPILLLPILVAVAGCADRRQPGPEPGRDHKDRDHVDRERNGGDAPRAIDRHGGKARSGSRRETE